MVVLALDTTTAVGSVALVVDDRIVDERPGDQTRTHAQRLPGELLAVAAAHGVGAADVDLFAVASGPGSFTGLRIGIATIQGLAVVTARRIAAISALDALAAIGGANADTGTLVAAWMDAHRRDVFAALYRVTAAPPYDAARLEVVEPAMVDAPDAVLERWRDVLQTAEAGFIGDGAVLYAEAIGSAVPRARVDAPPPLAGAVGRLAAVRARTGGAIAPGDIRPLYVRRPDAVAARENAR